MPDSTPGSQADGSPPPERLAATAVPAAGAALAVRAGRLRRAVLGLDEAITGLLMLALVAVVTLQVLFRYLFYQPMGWTEEAGRYLFIWLSLLGAAVGVKHRAHFGLDLLIRRLPPPAAGPLQAVLDALGAAFCAVFTWFGGYLVAATVEQTSPGLNVPMAVPYLALPICGALMTVYFLRDAGRRWRRPREP